jgi:hypothetical protein
MTGPFSNQPDAGAGLTEKSLEEALDAMRAQMRAPLTAHPTHFIVSPEVWEAYGGDADAIRRDFERAMAGVYLSEMVRKP